VRPFPAVLGIAGCVEEGVEAAGCEASGFQAVEDGEEGARAGREEGARERPFRVSDRVAED